jgi:CheY-like chemotaxis protein
VSDNDAKAVADILYVEDDSASGRLVQSIVEREGYRITVAPNGQGFLKVLGESKPDLLVDFHLPMFPLWKIGNAVKFTDHRTVTSRRGRGRQGAERNAGSPRGLFSAPPAAIVA